MATTQTTTSVPANSETQSAILYQNNHQTVFLIDIPASISLAQQSPESKCAGNIARCKSDTTSIFSCSPLQCRYPGPPTEPKGAKARLNVTERIPAAELEYRHEIAALVCDALQELNANYAREWCLPRAILPRELQKTARKKRRRGHQVAGLDGTNEPDIMAHACQTRVDGASHMPPLILAPGLNIIPSLDYIQRVAVKNTSSAPAILRTGNATSANAGKNPDDNPITFRIPPRTAFLLTHMSSPQPGTFPDLLPFPFILSGKTFDFILMDPPWPNRSVRRSAHYQTDSGFSTLQSLMSGLLKAYLDPTTGIAAIWTTNNAQSRSAARGALQDAGLQLAEEWIWIKTTTQGDAVSPIDGLWRQPYEVLVIGKPWDGGKQMDSVKRRVIAAVPDVHSRKPSLKEMVERVFFTLASTVGGETRVQEYEALEVFARNLTAGWWSCGDEVLRFNWDGWWANAEGSSVT
ncbi:hypothetical protein PRK78_003252 [Emydomyces testavorans]|uniref:MT-A70-domain-containing protein n=1 Tax=Emydomyces testavorans TaxID=2070801 RepID=A0AAF0DHL3_9EURO|nr:hypothetical protein PRK78_003252 [Emydomyces testavorans]